MYRTPISLLLRELGPQELGDEVRGADEDGLCSIERSLWFLRSVFRGAEVGIAYPVRSPGGRLLLFDWFKPDGGDLWVADGETGREGTGNHCVNTRSMYRDKTCRCRSRFVRSRRSPGSRH